MEKTEFKNGRKKKNYSRGNCISKYRKMGMNMVCVGNNEKTRLNKDMIKNRRKLGLVGTVQHQVTKDLQSKTDKFGLKYNSKLRLVKCF